MTSDNLMSLKPLFLIENKEKNYDGWKHRLHEDGSKMLKESQKLLKTILTSCIDWSQFQLHNLPTFLQSKYKILYQGTWSLWASSRTKWTSFNFKLQQHCFKIKFCFQFLQLAKARTREEQKKTFIERVAKKPQVECLK